jgi:hypothetical protein
MTDDDIDKLHDSIDCWSGFGLGAVFDHRAFARKVEKLAREHCAELCGLAGEVASEMYGDGAECLSTASMCADAIRGGA